MIIVFVVRTSHKISRINSQTHFFVVVVVVVVSLSSLLLLLILYTTTTTTTVDCKKNFAIVSRIPLEVS